MFRKVLDKRSDTKSLAISIEKEKMKKTMYDNIKIVIKNNVLS
jgi:hypothetical protein